jgi:hypothetical protein
VQARLLSMEVGANISSAGLDPAGCKDAAPTNGESLVKMDPDRGSWGVRVLELELCNTTDVHFEITVNRKGGTEIEKLVEDGECLYPRTKIECEYSAHVLIQLDRFKLAGLDKASLAEASVCKDAMSKKDNRSKDAAHQQAKADLNSAIEELSSRICVKWYSSRNSVGVLPIKVALREALQATALNVLLPDPLTFDFRLVKTSSTQRSGSDKVEEDSAFTENKGGIVVWELALIEMLVRNNTSEATKMTVNITCQDVAGTSCLGTSDSNTTVLWAGTWRWLQWERWYTALLFAS